MSNTLETHDNILHLPGDAAAESFACHEAKGFIQLIANISARMIGASLERLDQEITLSLEEIFRSLKADRGGLLEVKEYPSVVNVSHAWYGTDVPQIPEDVNVVEHYPWAFHKILVERNILALTSVDAFPEDAPIDRASYAAFENKSSLVIPLFAGDRITHVFGIDVMSHECQWPVEIIMNLKLIGEIFATALLRRFHSDLLLQYKNRMEMAAHSAEVGLWELDRKTGQFWATKQARSFFDYSDDEPITMDSFLEKICSSDRELISGKLDRLSSPEDELAVEYRVPAPEGDRWMSSRGRLLPANGRDRDVLMGATLEITDRKKMEEELSGRLNEINELRQKLEEENLYLRKEISLHKENQDLLGNSPGMRAIMGQVEQVAGTDSTVLVQGETGTGKELLAQTIHQMSNRSGRAMVKVNCAALPEALVESELFGREKGAYTGALSRQAGHFELADGSSLFLDEITEMPLEAQAKLLRVLQNGELQRLGNPKSFRVNVRVIAASNRDMVAEVERGRFRRDLYYRLSIFPITIPPLRERIEDIPQLVWEFIRDFEKRMGKRVRKISKSDMDMLQAYSWPGNVRELRNVIEHAMIVSHGDTLELKALRASDHPDERLTKLVDVERQHIASVLKLTNGRIKGKEGAAELLGMKPSTLYSRMKKLNMNS